MITVNITKAKAIAHDMRRAARAEEFAPHDEIIMKQIPGVSASSAEAARAVIREKYAVMQDQIDAVENVESLKEIIRGF
jgi:hypothetical protein